MTREEFIEKGTQILNEHIESMKAVFKAFAEQIDEKSLKQMECNFAPVKLFASALHQEFVDNDVFARCGNWSAPYLEKTYRREIKHMQHAVSSARINHNSKQRIYDVTLL